MKILLIILFVIYGLYMVYRMLIEQTDEYLEESMKRAYSLAKRLEEKE